MLHTFLLSIKARSGRFERPETRQQCQDAVNKWTEKQMMDDAVKEE